VTAADTSSLRVAWVDTDAGGRIHFTAAFRYAERAETALLRQLGLVDRLVDYPRRRVEAAASAAAWKASTDARSAALNAICTPWIDSELSSTATNSKRRRTEAERPLAVGEEFEAKGCEGLGAEGPAHS
jgi:hypothetical protein